MANEILSVPEAHLAEVIKVIRAGLRATTTKDGITRVTRKQLNKWCDEEEEYLQRGEDD